MYGLRQAAKLWYELLAIKLKKIGFQCSSINNVIFISTRNGQTVYILVNINEIVIVGYLEAIQGVKRRL